MKDFIKEFYRLSIRSRLTDKGEEEVANYVNGMKYAIQDYLILSRFMTFRGSYQLALKVEEKLSRTLTSRGNSIARS